MHLWALPIINTKETLARGWRGRVRSGCNFQHRRLHMISDPESSQKQNFKTAKRIGIAVGVMTSICLQRMVPHNRKPRFGRSRI